MPTAVPNPLLAARIIWAALVLGQLAFLAVAIIVTQTTGVMIDDPELYWILLGVCAGLAVATVGGGYAFRAFQHRQRREDGTLNPQNWFTGNMIFWACCEGPALFAIVIFLISARPWPTLLIPAILIAIQLATYPTADPLRTPRP